MKLTIRNLGAEVLRKTFTESELKNFGVFDTIKRAEDANTTFLKHTVAQDLYEGSFGAAFFQFYAMEIPDYFIDFLFTPPSDKYKDAYRRELIDLYTGMGIMLSPSTIEKIKQLPPKEQDFLQYAIKRNQDYEVWKSETEDHLNKGSVRSAYYRIRNLPAFGIYKDRIIVQCNEKKDYETLALICYKQHLYLPELRSIADQLLEKAEADYALAALFVLQDKAKMEEVARQLA